MAQTKASRTTKTTGKKAIPRGSADMTAPLLQRWLRGEESVDIVDAIKEDHKPLKELIKIMKGEDPTFAQKKSAFKKFAAALVAHAKPEEKTWYAEMKASRELKIDGLEGDVEHQLADQLCAELKRTTARDLFMAKVKVLAELVEHHIKEEENDMLPEFEKNSTADERYELGAKYLKLRAAYLTH